MPTIQDTKILAIAKTGIYQRVKNSISSGFCIPIHKQIASTKVTNTTVKINL